jgi:hypothetical protein
LYRCADCGFVTTASRANAALAHQIGSPQCPGAIDLIADFATTPAVVRPAGSRRRSASRRTASADEAPQGLVDPGR